MNEVDPKIRVRGKSAVKFFDQKCNYEIIKLKFNVITKRGKEIR